METPYPTSCLQKYQGIKNTTERIKEDLIKGGILDRFDIDGYVEQRDSLIHNYDSENETYENNDECQYGVSALAAEIWINSYNLDSGNVECNFLVIGNFRLPSFLSSFITKEQKEFGAEGYKHTSFTYTPKEDQANEIKADTEIKANEDTFCFTEPEPITSPQEDSKAEPAEQKINPDDLSSSETNGFIAILNQAAKSPAEEKPDASIADARQEHEAARARTRAEERARREAEREAMKQERKAQRIAKKQTKANEEVAKLTNNKSAGRKSKKPAPEKLLTEYETLTAKELAKKYKVNETTIRKWIKDARDTFKNIPNPFAELSEPLAKKDN